MTPSATSIYASPTWHIDPVWPDPHSECQRPSLWIHDDVAGYNITIIFADVAAANAALRELCSKLPND
jgi:hypothetical protein